MERGEGDERKKQAEGGEDRLEKKMEMEGEKGEEKEVVVVFDSSTEKELAVAAPPTSTAMVSRMHPPTPLQVVLPGTPATPASAASGYQSTPGSSQISLASLNSRVYTNRACLLLFLFHILAAGVAVCFFCYKAIQVGIESGSGRARRERRMLRYWLPPVEGAALMSIVLAFAWQKAFRTWPAFMVNFILWSCFLITMTAGCLLLVFEMPAAAGIGACLILFSIGTGLYACWVTRRTSFTGKVFTKALQPAEKFRSLNGPAYLMIGSGFVWISIWCLAVIGALNFYYPPLTILALVLSLAWTAEVMRNVANLTVSRVIALYYLRGMQSSTQFSFQRATSLNLGSACLGSFFVPTIEALRILARALNLLEGEDEFLFSCAHCCLHVMEGIFRYGNSWAFVHIAAYGRGFVSASKSTWGLFERQKMEELVDSDITSTICFLTGVTSGALAVILAASWSYTTDKKYTATTSLIAFFIGYLMTRIGMALPQACVACYYVCYAENSGSRLFDSTIPERLDQIRSGRDGVVSTPRFPRRTSA